MTVIRFNDKRLEFGTWVENHWGYLLGKFVKMVQIEISSTGIVGCSWT